MPQLGLGSSLTRGGVVYFNNTSLLFDGSNDYVELVASSTLITGTNVTYACWAKVTDTDRTYLISTQKGSSSTNLSLSVNANEGTESGGWITVLVWNGSSHTFVKYDGNIDDSAWHHYVFTTTSSAQVLYLDGASVATGSNTFSNAASSHKGNIGALNAADYFLGGNADEVAIWSVVLDSDDVSAIYNSGTPNDLTLASSYNTDRSGGLEGYWRFEEGSGTSATDSSGNSATGTINGATYSGDVVR